MADTDSLERIRKALEACEATQGADKPYEVYSDFRGELANACNPVAIRSLLAREAALREALAELVACKDMKDVMRTVRSDPYYITEADRLEAQYDQRRPLAWERARAALASTEPTKD